MAGLPSPPPSASPSLLPQPRHCPLDDDGSVASMILGRAGSPARASTVIDYSCKESVRESPYQRRLQLKRMKLHHCAEELGSESSSSDYAAFTEFLSAADDAHHQPLISPNPAAQPYGTRVGCSSRRPFPPPLSTPAAAMSGVDSTSSSCDTLALIACREEGRLLLRQVRLPCRNCFTAQRKHGRLTLRLICPHQEGAAAPGIIHELPDATTETLPLEPQPMASGHLPPLSTPVPRPARSSVFADHPRLHMRDVNANNNMYDNVKEKKKTKKKNTFDKYRVLITATNHADVRALLTMGSVIRPSCGRCIIELSHSSTPTEFNCNHDRSPPDGEDAEGSSSADASFRRLLYDGSQYSIMGNEGKHESALDGEAEIVERHGHEADGGAVTSTQNGDRGWRQDVVRISWGRGANYDYYYSYSSHMCGGGGGGMIRIHSVA